MEPGHPFAPRPRHREKTAGPYTSIWREDGADRMLFNDLSGKITGEQDSGGSARASPTWIAEIPLNPP